MNANYTIKVPAWLDRIFTWPLMAYRKRKYGYDFRRIYLGEGTFTLVDTPDYYRFGRFRWYLTGDKGKFYAVRELKVDSTRTTTLRLHREIMNAPKGLLVDHQNNDGLDNRRSNLRLATRSQNTHNSPKTKSKTSSKYIGVYFDKNCGKWHARIHCRGKKIDLGRFDTEVEAARAYDAAAKKYFGEFARLNFS